MKTDLKLYDTASRQKKEFQPVSPGRVKMYCCGPTVYDYLHIGNFRGAVVFNFARNWLEALGFQVEYIYNFTDIDDKILNRAKKEGVLPKDLAEKYIAEFKKDYLSLKLKAHTANPRATQTLPEIIELIQKLLDKKSAYQVDGDVFFSVSSFKGYGALSGKNPNELLSGARIEPDQRKKSPLDFALWKSARPDETWRFESPWGFGRPGWHIECSAMIYKFFGGEIDIHAGGSDLMFPHHENERAQSCCATNQPFARFWLHNNMIAMQGDKMSKSKGNILKMRDFLKKYPGEVFKFLILSCHYRSPLQFSKKTVKQAVSSLSRIYTALALAKDFVSSNGRISYGQKASLKGSLTPQGGRPSSNKLSEKQAFQADNFIPFQEEGPLRSIGPQAHQSLDALADRENESALQWEAPLFARDLSLARPSDKKGSRPKGDIFLRDGSQKALAFYKTLKETGDGLRLAFNDDLASPKAFALLFGLTHSFQKLIGEDEPSLEEKLYCAQGFLNLFQACGASLGLFQEEPTAFLRDLDDRLLKEKNLTRQEIDKKTEARAQARKQKDFKTADRLRRELEGLGLDLKDGPEGSSWELKK